MKLHQHTLLYLSISLFVMVCLWGAFFYFNMLDEVYDSLDDGLANSKMLIIQKALTDSTTLNKSEFGESNYSIRPVTTPSHWKSPDIYKDTLTYRENENDLEPARMLTTTFKDGPGSLYELKILTSMVEEDDLIQDLWMSLVLFYGALLVSIVILNNLILRKVWKPFYVLIDRLDKFRLGKDFSFQPPETRVYEFELLNKTVSDLLKKNIEIFKSQNQFISDASHELQTPLAIGINKLELMAEKNNLPEDSMKTVGEVIESLERLTRLNQSLLLISRIENRQFATSEPVNFNQLLLQMIEDFSDLTEFRNIHLDLKEEATLIIPMNKDLAVILLTNLLKNAIVHNVPKGEVVVLIQANQLVIENTGIAASLNEPRIFDRFYRAISHGSSTGLGLSIVKSIAELYDFNIRYTFEGRHIFTLHV